MDYLLAQTHNIKLSRAKQLGPYSRRIAVTTDTVKAKDRTVIGICSVFGNADHVGDIVAPGAFKRSIEDFYAGRSRCRFLWQHDTFEPPIAQLIELKEVGRGDLPAAYRGLLDVTGGLMVTRKYFEDSMSDRVFQGVISKAITEMSFAYHVVKAHVEKDSAGREVKVLDELDLMDVSDVNHGCNPLTLASVKRGPEIVQGSSIAGLRMLKDMRREMMDLEARLQPPESRETGDFDRWLKAVRRDGRGGPVFKNTQPLTSSQMRREFAEAFGKAP